MKLFSQAQIDEVNKVAEKSKQAFEKPKLGSISSLNDELHTMSKNVEAYFKDSNAILITDKSQLHDYISKVIDCGYFGIDTETTGLDRYKDHIIGSSLYYPGGVECYIPNKHRVPIFENLYKSQLSYDDVQVEFQRLVDNKCKAIFANADFDLSMIYKDYKVDMCPIFYYDVILAWRCLKENEIHNGLKALYNKYVLKGEGDPKKFSDFFTPTLFPYCKPEVAKLYAANDAKITYELFKWQLPFATPSHPACKKHHLEDIANIIWNLEFPLVSVCQSMHRTGMYFDSDTSNVLRKRYDDAYKHELAKLGEMVQDALDNADYKLGQKRPFTRGKDFNPTSPPQVKYLCYEILKLPKSGNGSTNKEVLKDFNHPITDQILKVRSFSTLISTFVEKLPHSVWDDNKIHANFKQIGASCVTGDTLIPTTNGYLPISDICKCCGDQHNELVPLPYALYAVNKNQQLEKIDSAIMHKNVPTIKLTLEQGLTLEGTYDHPIMVSKYTKSNWLSMCGNRYQNLHTFWNERNFKKLKDVHIGDYVEIPCNYSLNLEYQPTNLEIIPAKTHNRVEATMPKIYSEEFAEFLGMYHADGHSEFRDGTYRITLSNDDPDVYNRFDNLAKSLFNVKTVRYDKHKDVHEVDTYINCIQISQLDTILYKGKRNKRIPEVIRKSPISVINSYIKGITLHSSVYFDKTGKANFELSIMNIDDVRFIQLHLISQGILSHVSKNVKGVSDKFLRLSFNADNYIRFRDTIGFIESKKIVQSKICGKNKYKYRRIGNSFRLHVKQIEYRTNDVYDLHIPGTHSFISNGLISHNTGRFSSESPNCQNIPSRRKDIRHQFRATPQMNKNIDCDVVDQIIVVKLSKFDSVKISDNNYVEVKNLTEGTEVLLFDNDNKKEVSKIVKSIQYSDKDSSVCITFE